MAYPMHFIMKKIDDNSYYYNDGPAQDYVFTCFGIHDAKVAEAANVECWMLNDKCWMSNGEKDQSQTPNS
jgi:hypothetical protein